MEKFTMEDLRGFLQAVRGETRIKVKEEGVRNTFLQSALYEIFQEHDWPFNEEVVTLQASTEDDTLGWFEAPADFSIANDWSLGVGNALYEKEKVSWKPYLDQATGKIWFRNVTGESAILDYFRLAPDLKTDSQATAYFPNPMLIAERAYVRLKTAYFPDESSDKELKMSKAALRALYTDMIPLPNFTPRYRRR